MTNIKIDKQFGTIDFVPITNEIPCWKLLRFELKKVYTKSSFQPSKSIRIVKMFNWRPGGCRNQILGVRTSSELMRTRTDVPFTSNVPNSKFQGWKIWNDVITEAQVPIEMNFKNQTLKCSVVEILLQKLNFEPSSSSSVEPRSSWRPHLNLICLWSATSMKEMSGSKRKTMQTAGSLWKP